MAMTVSWRTPELTAQGRRLMHAVPHAERLPLDGRWRFQLLSNPDQDVAAAHLRHGSNTLRLTVVKWSDATFVEDQDQWWHGGITRSVYLYVTGIDPEARATLAGAVRELVVVEAGQPVPMLEVARAR